jgi:hypothetical protein
MKTAELILAIVFYVLSLIGVIRIARLIAVYGWPFFRLYRLGKLPTEKQMLALRHSFEQKAIYAREHARQCDKIIKKMQATQHRVPDTPSNDTTPSDQEAILTLQVSSTSER